MNRELKKRILTILLITLSLVGCGKSNKSEWELKDISFKAREGFRLNAYIVKPTVPNGKYPAVAALHQLWGNRDDFLKLFPLLAEKGIVILAPDFPRQRPNLSLERISDLRDSVEYLESLNFVDKKKLGIITSSFSVDTGLLAIKGKKNIIADVMLSGPVISEDSRKWITRNSDLAIFTITSVYDEKPGQPAHHHLIMEELLKRSLNPFSGKYFITDKKNIYSVYAHGTFVFDEIPKSLKMVADFFSQRFHSNFLKGGSLKKEIPLFGVEMKSRDGFPVFATFKYPAVRRGKIPAVILYPPQFMNRRFYNSVISRFISRGIAVLIPNTKRTCRRNGTLHLCEKEIGGAVDFLKKSNIIDPKRIGILLPSFYFLFAEKMIREEKLPFKAVIFMKTREMNYGIDPYKLTSEKYLTGVVEGKNFEKILYLFRKKLK